MAGLIVEATKAKSDQLNASDLIGTEIIIKITKVTIDLAKEQPVTVHAETADGKKLRAFKPCKNMGRVMQQGWGDDEAKYAGKFLRLFCDPKVTWAGQEVGGVRVNGMSNIKNDFTFNYRKSRTTVEPMKIAKLDMATVSAPQPVIASQETIEAGDAAAAKGVAAYTTWKDGLAPEVKATIKPYHAAWSKAAVAADSHDDTEEVAI